MRCPALQVALLLVVAGYQHLDSLADVSADGLRQHFEVNSIGPLMAVQALRPWLVSGTKARVRKAASGGLLVLQLLWQDAGLSSIMGERKCLQSVRAHHRHVNCCGAAPSSLLYGFAGGEL